jgi:hypothetical protein
LENPSTRGNKPSSHRTRHLAFLKAASVGIAAVLALVTLIPEAFADGTVTTDANTQVAATSHLSATDPLNGGFLIVNMHGMLFHPAVSDIQEDLSYARWLGGGVVRVFGTDSSGGHKWNGTQVGMRIAQIAPMLRASNIRLIVAFVNNHQAVPGEAAGSAGWMDGYMQLLLPFYTSTWRGAYLQFVHDLITTVQAQGALDVIYAWELGNELHTPQQPNALVAFITQDVAEVRALDAVTPILPGTMGANHVEPGNQHSPIARWLYCDAPVDAYSLHAYDWVSQQRPGDMPIDWDLDNIVSQPCQNGRALPVIIEELGTSRALPGVYTAQDEQGRLQQEQRQIQFVRQFPQVVGFGVWNGESPRLVDRTFVDTRRGLTSYGSNAQGGGSCYDPTPDPAPGARCQLEQTLRQSTFLRVNASSQWTPGPGADPSMAANPIIGSVDTLSNGQAGPDGLAITGWVADPAAQSAPGVDRLSLYAGADDGSSALIASAQVGLSRSDPPSAGNAAAAANDGFALHLPLANLATGTDQLTLAAHTVSRGTWLSTVRVVIPTLGSVPLVVPTVQVTAAAPAAPQPQPLQAQIQAPQPGDKVQRNFTLQVLAPDANRVDVFLDPDRDLGGRLVGSTSQAPGQPFKVSVNAPLEAQTLWVHVSSSVLGEEVLKLPVVVKS